MVNANAKFSKKRKNPSGAGKAEGASPQKNKANETQRTSNKGQAAVVKPNNTPAKNKGGNKTPKLSIMKNTEQVSAITNITKKNKRSSDSESGSSSPKKPKMFSGTSGLDSEGDQSPVKGNQKKGKPQKGKADQAAKDGKSKIQNKKKGKFPNPKAETGGVEGAKKKKKGQFFELKLKVTSNKDKDVVKEIDQKIAAIESRSELTKTAKRKIKLLRKLKEMAINGGELPAEQKTSVSKKRRERKKSASEKGEGNKDTVQKPQNKAEKPTQTQKSEKLQEKKVGKPQDKASKLTEESNSEEESSESDYDVESSVKPGKVSSTALKEDDSDDDSAMEDDESNEAGEESEDEEESGEEEESDGGEVSGEEVEQEDSEEEAEGEEDSDEEAEENQTKAKPKIQKQKPQQPKQVGLKDLKENDIVTKGQKRYVLFVGNLPYDATKEEITDHFKKVGQIKDVRVPSDSKTNKPRGFAYVEVENEEAYQRALSLHNTFIKGRRINVLYSQGGKKKGQEKKGEIKAKNLKLHTMRKQGQLAGSVKESQKRSARRGKKNKAAVNGS